MRDVLSIGSPPWDEACAQVGQPDYDQKAREECRRFMRLLRQHLGPEPEGAQLAIKSFPHDFGDYLDVVCWFETGSPASTEYALRCESETPATWEG
jgi:hypothetical protein